MKKLEKQFKRSGFNHKQVRRNGNVAIYERCGVNHGDPHYEVIKISSHDGYYLGGVKLEATETYPGASLWGIQGWTCQNIESAEKRFKKACTRFNKQLQYA